MSLPRAYEARVKASKHKFTHGCKAGIAFTKVFGAPAQYVGSSWTTSDSGPALPYHPLLHLNRATVSLLRMSFSVRNIALAIVVVLGLSGSTLFGFSISERYFISQINTQSDASLRLAASGLSGALQQFETIPTLLADRAEIRSILSGNPTEEALLSVNELLKSVAQEVGASDIYIMNENGVTIAASNFDQETTFIGNSYTFRPYFSDAIVGKHGRYYALGTSSLKRGYYFSAPVLAAGRPIGVMALKFTVDELEQEWSGFNHNLIVTDPDNIIFMSSQKSWLFSSLGPIGPGVFERLGTSKRYPIDQLRVLDAEYTTSTEGARLRLSSRLGGVDYLVRSQFMPKADWTLHILTDRTTATRQAVQATSVAGLLVVLIIVVSLALMNWRYRQARHIKEQEEAKQLLENRVAERTSDLQREISERIQAEKDLRKAQTDLVQAGKLAALGQMSASLSHELNQPLSAVKTYADNAGAFLERDRIDEAKENLTHISAMADRMANISNSLRNFARKPRENIGTIRLAEVMKDVEQIMVGRLVEAGATLSISPFSQHLSVVGGHVRLQQVLVNLVSNALDAMEGIPNANIEVSVEEKGDTVDIHVTDHGRGISSDIFEQIFDPFFTTKGVNQGLGLGLSISFNILRDFGGNLSAKNLSTGGAKFTATLVKTETIESASR